MTSQKTALVIGGGFTGLSAGLELAEKGYRVIVAEKEAELGGLAGTFNIKKFKLEKFYHHWFNNDLYVMEMIKRLGLEKNIKMRSSKTGMYFANQIFRLSTPLDVLKFTPLNLLDRCRLGWLVFQVKKIKNWRTLESLTVKEWLISLCGKQVYTVVWEPLLIGKFGLFAEDISAVWFWKKLVLRGGSRGRGGKEELAYFEGGFSALANAVGKAIEQKSGTILTHMAVQDLIIKNNKIHEVKTSKGNITADVFIATPALPIIADIVQNHLSEAYVKKLRRINYLGNVCLVLALNRSLSNTYWLNVNDPSFPYVGVIEHTNFEPIESYGGSHIVYLSKYLPTSDPLYSMSDEEIYTYSLPHLKRMFPEFNPSWLIDYYVWRADHAQPIVEKNYSQLIPDMTTPLENLYISTMAQVYPEDRGTNYAIREGQRVAHKILENN